jgi:predicted NBD/HSP70 family sugar kinase
VPADFFYSDKPENSAAQNKVRVLELIRDKKEITRADIIKFTQLSAPTVTRIIETLLDKKIITHDELAVAKKGRPPQIIRFAAKSNYVVGIDIGGSFVRGTLSNLDGEFLHEVQLPTAIHLGFDGVMEQVGGLIHKLRDRESMPEGVSGIGISVCGMVNSKTGIVAYSPVFNWSNVDIYQALKKYTDLRIAVGNSAQLLALGELYYGIGAQFDHFIALGLGYGIGSGIVVNRQPFHGWEGYTGEIGHIVVDARCPWKGREGIYGTLEALASGYGIMDIAKEMMKTGEVTTLSNHPITTLDARAVMDAALNGDPLAARIVNAAADYIGISLDILIKLFNPQAICFSGGLLRNDYVMERIKSKVESLSLPPYQGKTAILPSSFGDEASLMGAVSLILQKILHLE